MINVIDGTKDMELKNPLQSLTIWGSLMSLGSCVEILHDALQTVPAEALPPQAGAAVTATVGILGAVLSIIGRVKATKKISLRPQGYQWKRRKGAEANHRKSRTMR